MKRKIIFLSLSLIFLSGCWDSKELNERAIGLATGWDLGKNNDVRITAQIVIPSGTQSQSADGSGTSEDSFTVSAAGKNTMDAAQNIRAKLSREIFLGHRRVIFFGEDLVKKRSLKNILDHTNRTPEINLRTDAFVVKGGKASEALKLTYPLEKPPSFAAIKEHYEVGGRGDKAYLNFLMAATSYGMCPTLPAIEIIHSLDGNPDGNRKLQISGVAVFNRNLTLQGFLNREEQMYQMWIMGFQKRATLTILLNKDSNASLNLTKLKSKIVPVIKNNRIHFTIFLKGEGAIPENNSKYDINQSNNVNFFKREFEKHARENALRMIKKVQKKYSTDIFGLGEEIHRKNPNQWKQLKNDWDHRFSAADISVKADLKINRIGMTGPSLLLKESEIKK